mmetsp:Transcript_84921/g.147292  ORF Transcript_84921/g.147292 Transcript_84921/m.147292 type:complete len:299 (-) Transcript_84921:77-973(-)
MTVIQSDFAGSFLVAGAPVVLLLLGQGAFAINSITVAQPNPQAVLADEGFAQPGTPKPADSYKVALTVGNLNDASSGTIVIQVHPDWAPIGAQRFKSLVDAKFYDKNKFFRVITGFMAQFGLAADATVNRRWEVIKDDLDTPTISNSRGRVTFATAGKDTRSTQIFINTVDNLYLDKQGFTPFAEVIKGMDVVDKLFAGYGEGAPLGKGPSQNTIERQGNTYLDASFPHLSTIQTARIVAPPGVFARHRRAITILLHLAGLTILLASGTTAAYRTGHLSKWHAQLKARMSSAAALHNP